MAEANDDMPSFFSTEFKKCRLCNRAGTKVCSSKNQCICKRGYQGSYCQWCISDFKYVDLTGKCLQCPCNLYKSSGKCHYVAAFGDVVCVGCRAGYTGRLCDKRGNGTRGNAELFERPPNGNNATANTITHGHQISNDHDGKEWNRPNDTESTTTNTTIRTGAAQELTGPSGAESVSAPTSAALIAGLSAGSAAFLLLVLGSIALCWFSNRRRRRLIRRPITDADAKYATPMRLYVNPADPDAMFSLDEQLSPPQRRIRRNGGGVIERSTPFSQLNQFEMDKRDDSTPAIKRNSSSFYFLSPLVNGEAEALMTESDNENHSNDDSEGEHFL